MYKTCEVPQADAQESDVDRVVSMNMEHVDFVVEETWRWALSCTIPHALRVIMLRVWTYPEHS